MDIKKYIDSGILEQYILGHKTDPEVEEMINKYPEIQKEIEKIETAIEVYAQLHSIEPPKGLLDNILEKTST